jgi:hypothetical protein
VSERLLEIVRQPDGRFLATFDDDRPAVPVASWADVRRLRDRHHQNDHWTGEDRAAFIAAYGDPFDDWWDSLPAAVRAALMADPHGPVPPEHAEELKRSLRKESGRDGLRVEGSSLTAAVQAYVARRASGASAESGASPGS